MTLQQNISPNSSSVEMTAQQQQQSSSSNSRENLYLNAARQQMINEYVTLKKAESRLRAENERMKSEIDTPKDYYIYSINQGVIKRTTTPRAEGANVSDLGREYVSVNPADVSVSYEDAARGFNEYSRFVAGIEETVNADSASWSRFNSLINSSSLAFQMQEQYFRNKAIQTDAAANTQRLTRLNNILSSSTASVTEKNRARQELNQISAAVMQSPEAMSRDASAQAALLSAAQAGGSETTRNAFRALGAAGSRTGVSEFNAAQEGIYQSTTAKTFSPYEAAFSSRLNRDVSNYNPAEAMAGLNVINVARNNALGNQAQTAINRTAEANILQNKREAQAIRRMKDPENQRLQYAESIPSVFELEGQYRKDTSAAAFEREGSLVPNEWSRAGGTIETYGAFKSSNADKEYALTTADGKNSYLYTEGDGRWQIYDYKGDLVSSGSATEEYKALKKEFDRLGIPYESDVENPLSKEAAVPVRRSDKSLIENFHIDGWSEGVPYFAGESGISYTKSKALDFYMDNEFLKAASGGWTPRVSANPAITTAEDIKTSTVSSITELTGRNSMFSPEVFENEARLFGESVTGGGSPESYGAFMGIRPEDVQSMYALTDSAGKRRYTAVTQRSGATSVYSWAGTLIGGASEGAGIEGTQELLRALDIPRGESENPLKGLPVETTLSSRPYGTLAASRSSYLGSYLGNLNVATGDPVVKSESVSNSVSSETVPSQTAIDRIRNGALTVAAAGMLPVALSSAAGITAQTRTYSKLANQTQNFILIKDEDWRGIADSAHRFGFPVTSFDVWGLEREIASAEARNAPASEIAKLKAERDTRSSERYWGIPEALPDIDESLLYKVGDYSTLVTPSLRIGLEQGANIESLITGTPRTETRQKWFTDYNPAAVLAKDTYTSFKESPEVAAGNLLLNIGFGAGGSIASKAAGKFLPKFTFGTGGRLSKYFTPSNIIGAGMIGYTGATVAADVAAADNKVEALERITTTELVPMVIGASIGAKLVNMKFPSGLGRSKPAGSGRGSGSSGGSDYLSYDEIVIPREEIYTGQWEGVPEAIRRYKYYIPKGYSDAWVTREREEFQMLERYTRAAQRRADRTPVTRGNEIIPMNEAIRYDLDFAPRGYTPENFGTGRDFSRWDLGFTNTNYWEGLPEVLARYRQYVPQRSSSTAWYQRERINFEMEQNAENYLNSILRAAQRRADRTPVTRGMEIVPYVDPVGKNLNSASAWRINRDFNRNFDQYYERLTRAAQRRADRSPVTRGNEIVPMNEAIRTDLDFAPRGYTPENFGTGRDFSRWDLGFTRTNYWEGQPEVLARYMQYIPKRPQSTAWYQRERINFEMEQNAENYLNSILRSAQRRAERTPVTPGMEIVPYVDPVGKNLNSASAWRINRDFNRNFDQYYERLTRAAQRRAERTPVTRGNEIIAMNEAIKTDLDFAPRGYTPENFGTGRDFSRWDLGFTNTNYWEGQPEVLARYRQYIPKRPQSTAWYQRERINFEMEQNAENYLNSILRAAQRRAERTPVTRGNELIPMDTFYKSDPFYRNYNPDISNSLGHRNTGFSRTYFVSRPRKTSAAQKQTGFTFDVSFTGTATTTSGGQRLTYSAPEVTVKTGDQQISLKTVQPEFVRAKPVAAESVKPRSTQVIDVVPNPKPTPNLKAKFGEPVKDFKPLGHRFAEPRSSETFISQTISPLSFRSAYRQIPKMNSQTSTPTTNTAGSSLRKIPVYGSMQTAALWVVNPLSQKSEFKQKQNLRLRQKSLLQATAPPDKPPKPLLVKLKDDPTGRKSRYSPGSKYREVVADIIDPYTAFGYAKPRKLKLDEMMAGGSVFRVTKRPTGTAPDGLLSGLLGR